MIKFVKVKIDRKNQIFHNINFIEEIYYLYKKHERYLNDDYAQTADLLDLVITTIENTSPFFWVVLSGDNFAGFVFLENLKGKKDDLHSAEITTCFKKEYWGNFTKRAAKKFIRYCLKKLQFKKLKALVYKENTKTEAILKTAGMHLEAELVGETLKNNKLQDIKVYSIVKR